MLDWIRVYSKLADDHESFYFKRFAILARYGKGIDAERIMKHWPNGDVSKFMRALNEVLEEEKPKK